MILLEKEEYQKATLLSLLYDSGGRKNEVAQVEKHSFLDEKKSCTNIVVGKRGKKFPLLYFSKTKKCAKLWLEQRGNDDVDSLWDLRKRNDPEYKKAIAGEIKNFTGLDAPFEAPTNAALEIKTAEQTIEESIELIYNFFIKKIKS